ncbi:ABC transporter ATP-binding protein [Streptomonospora nanhaiensis]|uniref:ABC transporter ATP-binding protein n=1 Tax=Streptomonospora nanhaiensis TaxID=1323731 RepID=UPI001C37F082|nr:ABC transporter ATP-binding protein [Streptomonospora nanhaiensis]MBV2364642.1 ABC transporter ATP-binding protein/permease [Streptomonospora nanhaiensis]MBX9388704.1 ABC transporter ATP-binding protein/permease [Streptomonospora nanhaiensis]
MELPPTGPEQTPRRFTIGVILSAKRYTLPAAGLIVLWQLGEALVPVLMGVAIDRAIGGADPVELVLWVGVLVVNYLVFMVSFQLGSRIGLLGMQSLQHRLRTAVSERLLDPGGLQGAARLPGVGLSVASSDVSRLATAVAIAVYPLGEFAAIIFGGAVLFTLSWPLGLAVFVGAPAMILLIDRAGGTLRRRSGREQALAASAAGKAADLMAGYRIVTGLGAGPEAAARYRRSSRDALQATLHAKSAQGVLLGSMNAATGVFLAAITLTAGWQALSGSLSVGALITVVGLAQFLVGPMTMVATNFGTIWAAATASAERVLDVLRSPRPHERGTGTAPAEGADTGDPPEHGLDCELDLDLTLGSAALHGRVGPGECVAVPVDGAQAAELVAVLSGRAEPGTGRVHLAGRPLADAPPGTLLVAPHAADLFDGTVLENVAIGDAGTDRARAALDDAGCAEFLQAMPDGVHTAVGESGRRLSGGQRQRVALARALAQDAPVLVLHDPTTAVDSVTEQAVAARLRDCRQGRTTLLLTRSPALLAAADRVLDLVDAHTDADGGDESGGVDSYAGAPGSAVTAPTTAQGGTR